MRNCAEPQRAKHYLGLLCETSVAQRLGKISAEGARIFAAVFSGSQALSDLLVSHPDWLDVIEPERLRFGRRKQGLQQELEQLLSPLLEVGDLARGLDRVREFKAREMLRIGARDLAGLAAATEVVGEISDVADVCLENVWQICWRQLTSKFGTPFHQAADGTWRRTEACVLGMGKLGGQELNYSSDVDVLFVYSDEGQVFKNPPKRGDSSTLSNHQFFNRLAESFIAEVTRLAPAGALYRIDLRLRPEGDSGPLTRSLESYENYYAQWGQTWERMMLIKARGVAGSASLAAEFLELVHPFRYPRSINHGVLMEVGAMKDRIENEVVKSGELERNVKLGRGGIREIEFVAQALQLLHAGRHPFLQGPQTLPTLQKLAQYELLSAKDARALSEAYVFLRKLEHRLQMENNQQTHTIPGEPYALERLARLMEFTSRKEFEAARRAHTENVRSIFDGVLKGEVPEHQETLPFPTQFEGKQDHWKRLLTEHRFRDPERALRVLREFVEGPGYVHVSSRTSELAFRLVLRVFRLCPGPGKPASKLDVLARPGSLPASKGKLSDPDRVITRLDGFIAAYGARAMLFELWNSNPAIFDLLLLLFDRSEFLAELAIRTPDMVDELVTSGRLRQRKRAEETLRELQHGLNDKDQLLWLRRYHQTELMRIGLRDILGLADEEQYLAELSALADACLRYALASVLRKHRVKTPPFVVIGLGKLGGAEIDYGSDLDIVFVADSKAKNLAKLKVLALELIELLSSRTEQGLVFHVDTRLRPDGEKGLLVNTLDAFETYYRRRAMLWEIQTLTRTRPIAGDLKLGERFQRMARELTNFKHPPEPLSAYSKDWKSKIHQMRMRIQKERTPQGQDALSIKTGAGGLIDAEFIAQALCLELGWQEANTLRALERGRTERVLPEADKLIDNYRNLRRVEGILRRWSYEGETVLPSDAAPYYRVSVRCGFDSPEEFRQALSGYRAVIREVYSRVFENQESHTKKSD